MKKITQTGHIPLSSIGLIFTNYLRYFKIFFVFYFLPTCIFLLTIFFTHKEKIFTLLQNAKNYWIVSKTGVAPMIQAQEEILNQSLRAFASPTFFAILLLSLIVGVICYSSLLIGIKHCFYRRVNTLDVLKEGFVKLPSLLWTHISFALMLILTYALCFAVLYIPLKLTFGDPNIIAAFTIPLILLSLFVCSFFIFYIPIHFFSKNNPFSSMWYSMKTFWGNFIFMLVFGLLLLLLHLLVSFFVALPAYFIIRHYVAALPFVAVVYVISKIILPLVYTLVPYLSFRFISFFVIFIAYPELLDEDKVNTDIQITSNSNNEAYPSLPKEFFNDQNSKNISEQNFSGSNNTYQNKPVIKPSSGAEGLSVPNQSHQNNRPFLNQRIDQREFDRFTSRDQN